MCLLSSKADLYQAYHLLFMACILLIFVNAKLELDQVTSSRPDLTLPGCIAGTRKMIFELLRLSIDITDEQFDAIYPGNIRPLANKHWTPVAVAKTASGFLVGWPGS